MGVLKIWEIGGQDTLPLQVEGNSPLEDYFQHISKNGINVLSRQLLLIGLNQNEKSRRVEVINTQMFLDDFRERGQLS